MYFYFIKILSIVLIFLINACGKKASYDYRNTETVHFKTPDSATNQSKKNEQQSQQETFPQKDFPRSPVPAKLKVKSLKKKDFAHPVSHQNLFEEENVSSKDRPILTRPHFVSDEKRDASSVAGSDAITLDEKKNPSDTPETQRQKTEEKISEGIHLIDSESPANIFNRVWTWLRQRFWGSSVPDLAKGSREKPEGSFLDELKEEVREEAGDQKNKRSIRAMAIIGDSLSAGYVSDTTKGFRPASTSPAYSSGLAMTKNPKQFRDIFEQTLMTYKQKDGSAYYGKLDGASHGEMLGLHPSKVFNFSSLKTPLTEQALKIPKGISYVVVQSGFTDICNAGDFDDQAFLDSYDRLITSIHKNVSSNVLILLVPPLNLADIYASHKKTDPAFSLIPGIRPLSCEMIRDGKRLGPEARMCPLLSEALEGTDAYREHQKTFMDRYQSILDGMNRLKAEHDHVYVADSVKDLHLSAEYISVDCFHPNKAGHKLLAKSTWRSVQSLVRLPRSSSLRRNDKK